MDGVGRGWGNVLGTVQTGFTRSSTRYIFMSVCNCYTIEIYLNRYAYAENVTPETQAMFDRAITQINLEIVGINKRNWVKTPWLARQIHRYRGGNEYDAYYDLLSDGLHPTNGTLRYWARSLGSLMHRCS